MCGRMYINVFVVDIIIGIMINLVPEFIWGNQIGPYYYFFFWFN